MLYLAVRFAWFLLAALLLGVAMGWISQNGPTRRFWSRGWSLLAVLWAGGAALAWFQFVNGVPAMALETALLFVAVYWLGCVAGTLARPLGSAAATPAAEAAMPAAPVPAGSSPAMVIASVVDTPVRAAPKLAPVENEAALPGRRPSALVEAEGGKADDLKLIRGIGPQNERRLHGLGIWHVAQIAAWTPENVEWVGGYLAFPGRIEREDWVGQARKLAAGGTTEFADRTRAGRAETSRDEP